MNDKHFNKYYKKYAGNIFRFIYFKVSDFELAKDLTADTFTKFWEHIKAEYDIEFTKAFLYTIARGIVVDYYRKKKNRKQVSIDLIDERLLSNTDGHEERIWQRQEMEQVFATLRKLKKEYQEVLVLYYIEELSVDEMAVVLKKKENNIRVVIHRALLALKKLYER